MIDQNQNPARDGIRLFTPKASLEIYNAIFSWLSALTPGEKRSMSSIKYYNQKVWNPVNKTIIHLRQKRCLSEHEKEFLQLVEYCGPIFRLHNYNPQNKAHIFETEYHQSWSKSVEGLSCVTNYYGQVLLLIGQSQGGIDVFGLLTFMLKHKYLLTIPQYADPRGLCMYESEQEIESPVLLDSIQDIVIVDVKDLMSWMQKSTPLPRDKWKRDNYR